jgi:hypothetical protein
MRKLIVLSLAGLLILAFSAIGYAQAPKLEFRASGFIDTQTFIGEGVPQYTGSGAGVGTYGITNANYSTTGVGINVKANGWNKTDSHWEGRAHLKFDAVMGPNLSGTIYFEIDTLRWGSTFNSGGGTREANNYGAWTTDRTAVEVKNIYVDVGLPYFGVPWPVNLRVGAQPIGIRPNVLVYSDGTGVTAGIKIDPVLIMPIYAKALENLDFADDDADVWGLHANAKLGTFTVGAYGLLYRMNTYPLYVIDTSAAQTIFPGSSIQQFGQFPGTFKSHMWWWGAYTDGKAGPVDLNFDFVYDYGSVDERVKRDAGAGAFSAFNNIPDVKYEGWMVRGKVDYPWEKFNFGSVFMYATGADIRRTSSSGLPGTFVGSGLPGTVPGPGFQFASPQQPFGTTNLTRRNTSYVVPPGSEQGPSNMESMVVYSMEPGATGGYGIANNANYNSLSRGGFGGTWFAKLYASMKLMPWYKVTVQGLYIGDTTKNGDTFGNSVKYIQSPITSNGGTAPMMLRDNSNIGWEFDLINEIQIYNNLRFFIGAGYLFAGDALDVAMQHRGGIPGAPGSDITGMATGTIVGNRKADNPWAIRTRLQYTF